MAITHTTYVTKGEFYGNNRYFETWKSFLIAIESAYGWNSATSVTISKDTNYSACYTGTYGKYYFTENSYIQLNYYTSGYLSIKLVTPNGTRELSSSVFTDSTTTLSIGKTGKGICICAYSAGSGNTRDPRFYNLYVGELTLADGTTTKGCIYVADDNSHIIATDNGISSEATFNSVIDSTRKGYLIPVTDSTFGGVFKDVYMMACAPVQYNKFKIADTDKKYLCGKNICIAD